MIVSPDTWERKSDPTAYGKYWRTFVLNRDGRGETFAKFTASLPNSGMWRLEYSLPTGNFVRVRSYFGQTHSEFIGFSEGIAGVEIRFGDTIISESIDLSTFSPGWIAIGEYEIEQTDVDILVSNNTKTRIVFADAIRWTVVDSVSE